MKHFLSSFVVIFFIVSSSYATKDIPDIDTLTYKKTWLGLLHYDPNGTESSILNKNFFLSKKGKTDPKAELIETIRAYKKNDMSIICKYPARYYWLDSWYHWKDYRQKELQCENYNKWDLIANTKHISIVFVSGFLGNPASAFGHSFIKLNKTEGKHVDLLANTISYGAKLPEKYTMLSYIYNGVVGGYKASYSDEYYYMNDMTYANQEFRQMWEYQLHLTPRQQRLLLLHLWELRGVHFRYYFFNRNCGYKVSELLDVIEPEKIRDKAYIWYAPIETFFAMQSYPNKVLKVRYIPSAQQSVYAFYKGLSTKEKSKVITYIETNGKNKEDISHMNINSQIKVLDFLLDFQTYKMSSLEKGSEIYQKEKNIKHKLLLQRISLPKSHYQKPSVEQKLPITDYNPPNKIALSLFYNKEEKGLKLHYTPFAIDATGFNIYDGDILKVLETSISMAKKKISVSSLDLIRIRRLKVEALPFDIDNPLSWELYLGMNNTDTYDFFAKGGVGYSWKVTKYVKLYAMMDFSIHSSNIRYRANPYIGGFVNFEKLKVDIQYGFENTVSKSIKDQKIDIITSYHIDNRKSFFLQYKEDKLQRVSEIGMRWYF